MAEELETIIDESKTDEIINDLDSQLSAYKTMDETSVESDGDSTTTEERPKVTVSDELADKTNPLYYYQSGKKEGQLKPAGKRLLEGKAEPAKVNVDSSNKSIQGSAVISGILLITMIDLLFPLIVAVIHNQFSKDKKVKVSELSLKAGQKKELQPIADEVVKALNIEANPIHMFIISLLGIYGLNLVEARNKE